MFPCFFCAFLSFRAREFPAKYKTENLGKLLWNEPRMYNIMFYIDNINM